MAIIMGTDPVPGVEIPGKAGKESKERPLEVRIWLQPDADIFFYQEHCCANLCESMCVTYNTHSTKELYVQL